MSIELAKCVDDECVGEFWVMRTVPDEKQATMLIKNVTHDVTMSNGDTYKVLTPCAVNKKKLKEGAECTLFKPTKDKAPPKPVTFDIVEPSSKKTKVD